VALNVRVSESRPLTTTVYLDGRLDNQTVGVLDAQLEAIVDSPATVVVFDLANLEYISSVGLRSIFRMHKVMTARSGKALLVSPRPQVQKVLDIVNAVNVASVFSSVEELDQYLDLMQRRVTGGE
jgi:anti-anti-sigma factor